MLNLDYICIFIRLEAALFCVHDDRIGTTNVYIYIIAVTFGYRTIVMLRAQSATLSERQSARERQYTLVLIVQASR